MFSNLAEKYDIFNTLVSLNLDRSWRKKIAGYINPESEILDLCSGTGELAFEIARINSKVRIVALDFCRQMLDRAASKANSREFGAKIKWVLAKAEDLPLHEESFDYVTSSFALRNIAEHLDGVLNETYRVLRKGGRVLALEIGRPSNIFMRRLYYFYLKNVMPAVGLLIYRKKEPFKYLVDSIINFYSVNEMAVKFKRAGFREFQYLPLIFGTVGIYIATK